jgi:hypothetical protein
MTAQTVIAEIEALPASERAKVFAFVGEAMEADDSWIPESSKAGMTGSAQRRFVAGSLDELEDKLSEAVAQLDRGEGIPGKQVFAELEALSRQRQQQHG